MDWNKSIIDYISSKEWAINAEWGLAQFNEYIFNINSNPIIDTFTTAKTNSLGLSYYNMFGEDIPESKLIGSAKDKIVEINMSGVMHLKDGLCHYGAESVITQLRNAYSDKAIKGILFSIDSGGGDPQAGAEISQALKERNKPVVVRGTMIGSAAYMAAMGADEIIAANIYSKIGSIGAFVSINKQFLTQYKEMVLDIYAEQSENKNIEFRELINGNNDPIQTSVNNLAELFIQDVKKNRKAISDKYEDTFKGGVFVATGAKKRGLIDSIGTKQYAIKRIISFTN